MKTPLKTIVLIILVAIISGCGSPQTQMADKPAQSLTFKGKVKVIRKEAYLNTDRHTNYGMAVEDEDGRIWVLPSLAPYHYPHSSVVREGDVVKITWENERLKDFEIDWTASNQSKNLDSKAGIKP
jgi:uncharacterized protein YceK